MLIEACVTELCCAELSVTTRQDSVSTRLSVGSVIIVIGENRDISKCSPLIISNGNFK